MQSETGERTRRRDGAAARVAAAARPARVVIPAPANQNRPPLALRLARAFLLVAGVALAVWLIQRLV